MSATQTLPKGEFGMLGDAGFSTPVPLALTNGKSRPIKITVGKLVLTYVEGKCGKVITCTPLKTLLL